MLPLFYPSARDRLGRSELIQRLSNRLRGVQPKFNASHDAVNKMLAHLGTQFGTFGKRDNVDERCKDVIEVIFYLLVRKGADLFHFPLSPC